MAILEMPEEKISVVFLVDFDMAIETCQSDCPDGAGEGLLTQRASSKVALPAAQVVSRHSSLPLFSPIRAIVTGRWPAIAEMCGM